jgi:hypothetical protein
MNLDLSTFNLSDMDTAQMAYFSYLHEAERERCSGAHYSPMFHLAEDSLDPQSISRTDWNDMCCSVETTIDEDDAYKLASEDNKASQYHFAFVLSDVRRKTEGSVKKMTSAELEKIIIAKKGETYSWLNNNVFRILKRAGIPTSRIMSMRWVLTWKELPGGDTKAKARLVVRGYTDPDLINLRAESPTLSKVARHMMLQIAASKKWTPLVGDVKTAFLQGDNAEQGRNIYGDPPADCRKLFNMTPDQIIQFTGSVYGLRTAPKAWFQLVDSDLTKKLHFRQHQLDPCVFMRYENNELVGIIGVYVDDFLVAGNPQSTAWQKDPHCLEEVIHLGQVGV